MGEDWLAQLLSDRWFPAAVAYFLGLITGWLIWSGAKPRNGVIDNGSTPGDLVEEPAPDAPKENTGEAAAPAAEKSKNSKEPVAMKIGALESEIKKARKILADDAEENAVFADLLIGLDEAVKRANGRLKLIIKSVKRAKIDD